MARRPAATVEEMMEGFEPFFTPEKGQMKPVLRSDEACSQTIR